MNRIACYENAEVSASQNTFLTPACLRIRRPDGTTEFRNYGIGDTLEIMALNLRLLVPTHERWLNIPMPDGSTIDDIPDGVKFDRWW